MMFVMAVISNVNNEVSRQKMINSFPANVIMPIVMTVFQALPTVFIPLYYYVKNEDLRNVVWKHFCQLFKTGNDQILVNV